MITALVPGSFDPPTVGHLAVINAAAKLFDRVLVTVMENPEKHCAFSADERVEMLEKITADKDNVKVSYHGGMLWQYAADNGVNVIVKGIRDKSDFDYELEMADYNKLHCGAETLFVPADEDKRGISSSTVRQRASAGDSIEGLVPSIIETDISNKLKR